MRARHPSAGKAVVYVRVSGQPYGYDPFSPENQRRICRDHAIQEHVEIVAEYQDLAVSGRKDDGDRPGFEASIDQLRRREAEILYVANLDRFSRRGPRHVETLLDEIDRAGGRVVFVADGLDTRHPTAARAIAARAAQAQARRAMLAETIREVWVYGADVPVDRRVRIVWVGEEPRRHGRAIDQKAPASASLAADLPRASSQRLVGPSPSRFEG
jgi:DNA invertase Pin-like site-specific DNA recombinase